jgi:UDP-N-acetylmuramyl pentapeptide phosphotransferase/UDP-N-acetylglucosamine-1-phosphate transferase
LSDLNLNSCGIGFVLAAVLGCIGVALLRHWALRRKMFDIPNDRSLHQQPTPRGGGLVITLLVLIAWLPFSRVLGASAVTHAQWALLGCSAMIAAISWLDDLRGLSSLVRLLVHLIAAVIAVYFAGWWSTIRIPWMGEIQIGWAGFVLALFWVVGFTNAFNFMDGIDGIAGGQALVAGLGWAVIGWLNQQPDVCALGLLIAGGSLGFLIFNWPPAKIFMGDVGSAFLGFVLAVLPLLALNSRPDSQLRGYDEIAAAAMVWPFVCDAAFTFLRRWRKGENVFAAHRSHLYQRLVLSGFSHRTVTTLYFILAVAGVVMALAWRAQIDAAVLGVPILFAMLVLFVWRQEKKRSPVQ